MYLFKTSGSTFSSVIRNQKHAFASMPRDWSVGEIVLVSKNMRDCNFGEKQIQYTMRLADIRPLRRGEAEQYWAGNEGRWRYLVTCEETRQIATPFNLEDLLGDEYKRYAPVMTFCKISPEHEGIIEKYLRENGAI